MVKDGLVHIYMGNGKGKTTAAVGLGIRAYGNGFKVLLAQFLKPGTSGETEVLKSLGQGLNIMCPGFPDRFTWQMDERELAEVKKQQNEFFDRVITEAKEAQWDMLILDEILGAIKGGMIDAQSVERFIKDRPAGLEVVLTGRCAPGSLVDLADYVSEIREVKHPFSKGVGARKGIEE